MTLHYRRTHKKPSQGFSAGRFFILLALFYFSGIITVLGATRYSVNTGNWNSTATWSTSSGGASGASVPVAGDIVYIELNKTVTITAAAACANVSVASGSTLSIGGFNFTVSGTTTLGGTLVSSSTTGTKTLGMVVINGGTWTSNAAETHAITALTLSGSTFNGSATGIYNVTNNLTITAGTTNTFNAATIAITGTSSISGTLTLASATGTKTFTGALTINAGGTWNNTGNSAVTIRGNLTNEGTFNSGTGVYTLNGTAVQSILGAVAITMQRLTLNNTNGLTLGGTSDLTITTLLTFTLGKINTGSNALILGSAGTVSGAAAARYVNGNFQKVIASGTASKTFEIGDASNYTPVTIAFTGTTNNGGNITASTIHSDHPQISTVSIDPLLSVNRYWTLTNSGVTGFTSYSSTFTFVAGDVDAGATFSSFISGRYNSGTWSYPTVGTLTATTAQVTGQTSWGDFQFGQCGATLQAISGNAVPCEGTTGLTYSVNEINGSTYTWTVPAGWSITSGQNTSTLTVTSGSSTGNISVNIVTACGATGSQSLLVTPLYTPVASANSSSSTICEGSTVNLTASATPVSGSSTLLSESFNGATNSWTTINNSTGGTPANAAWTLRADGYAVSSVTFHSNDNSQFYLSNSDAQGSGTTTATILQSPAFNTTQFSTLSLSFWHYYRYYDGNETGNVEITTNGSTWTQLASYSSNQGTSSGFVNVVLNLNTYINYPSVMIRFKYDATYDWWWAIDNVSVTGTSIPYVYEYSWVGTPSGTAGLPSGSGTPSSTNSSITASPTANTVYTVTATSPGGCSSTANTSVTATPASPVSVSISASATTICSGSSVTFTATPVNGGTTPSYQWKVNGSNVGANSPTLVTSTLTNNDQVTCVLTSSITCTSGNPATSNTITMTVDPILVAGVSISASSNPICAGTSVTFTATPVNGGSSPTYQWKLNGTNVGTNSSVYTTNSLVNNDVITCVMSSNAGCITGNPATSNAITMQVGSVYTVGVTISANPGVNLCSGTIVEFTATPVNGGVSPSCQWIKNGINVGSNSLTYSDAGIATNDVVYCVLTSDLSCVTGNPATSNSLTMTVNPTPADPTSISASPSSFYSDYSGQIVLTASGGGGSGATMVWYAGGCGSGTSIGNGSSISISPPVSTTIYYARWERSSCYSTCLNTTVTVYTNFRSKSTGDWSQASTWEVNRGGMWNDAMQPPAALDGTITIRSPHIITVSSSGGYINVDETTIEPGGKLLVNVSPTNWWFSLVDGPGIDLLINGTMEYEDDQLPMASGATVSVGDGGKFQHDLNFAGNYPITVPTATWHPNSTYEVLSSNQLVPQAGLNQGFGNFTWNYPGQTSDICLGGALTSVAGNFSVLSTGSSHLQLTDASSLTLSIGGDLILQDGILDFSTGAAATKLINLSGNYLQTGGTFKNSGSNSLTVHFKGTGKSFTYSSGTIETTRIDWDVNAAASLTLNNNLPLASGQSLTLNGILDCGINQAVIGPGSFVMNNAATLIMGSPYGITDSPGSGNIQTSGSTFTTNGDFVYNGISAQLTGNRLPSLVRNMYVNNTAGLTLSQSLTVNGSLNLTNGIFTIDNQTLAFQNHDSPVVKLSGSIGTNSNTNLSFGTPGNMNGAAFTVPDNLYVTPPMLNNLSIYRNNPLTLNNQLHSIKGVLLCNGALVTNNKVKLLSGASQTALIDGTGTGTISGDVTMQRYISSGFGYKYFSSPFQSATVSTFSSYIDLLASFPVFYEYDENRVSSGWKSYTNPSGSLNFLRGYAANFGTSGTPVTFEMTGIVNNNTIGPIDLYNHNKTYTRGFNLVGNPYPSPIDWNAVSGWTRTNIDNAIYYFNAGVTDQYTGTYSSYVNGISSDGTAGNIIPSMQGFFVHVSDGSYPVTAAFSMNNQVRVNNLNPAFHKSVFEELKPEVRLRISYSEDPESSDYCVAYLENGAGAGFDRELDALKLMNTDLSVPNIYFNCPGLEELSINAIPEDIPEKLVLPMGVQNEREGWIEIMPSSIQYLPYGIRVFLVDSATGVIKELFESEAISIYLEQGEHPARFALVFSYSDISNNKDVPDQFKVQFVDHKLQVNLDLAKGFTAHFYLCNMLGQVVVEEELTGSGEHIIRCQPPAGIYIASLRTPKGSYSQKIYLGQP